MAVDSRLQYVTVQLQQVKLYKCWLAFIKIPKKSVDHITEAKINFLIEQSVYL